MPKHDLLRKRKESLFHSVHEIVPWKFDKSVNSTQRTHNHMAYRIKSQFFRGVGQ